MILQREPKGAEDLKGGGGGGGCRVKKNSRSREGEKLIWAEPDGSMQAANQPTGRPRSQERGRTLGADGRRQLGVCFRRRASELGEKGANETWKGEKGGELQG